MAALITVNYGAKNHKASFRDAKNGGRTLDAENKKQYAETITNHDRRVNPHFELLMQETNEIDGHKNIIQFQLFYKYHFLISQL